MNPALQQFIRWAFVTRVMAGQAVVGIDCAATVLAVHILRLRLEMHVRAEDRSRTRSALKRALERFIRQNFEPPAHGSIPLDLHRVLLAIHGPLPELPPCRE